MAAGETKDCPQCTPIKREGANVGEPGVITIEQHNNIVDGLNAKLQQAEQARNLAESEYGDLNALLHRISKALGAENFREAACLVEQQQATLQAAEQARDEYRLKFHSVTMPVGTTERHAFENRQRELEAALGRCRAAICEAIVTLETLSSCHCPPPDSPCQDSCYRCKVIRSMTALIAEGGP